MWKYLRVLRDPAAGQAGGAGADTMAKIVVEGDASKGISNWGEVFTNLVPQEMRVIKDKDNKDVPNPILSKYKSPAELVKGISEMNDLIGRKGVIMPTKDSKPEEWGAFYNAIGRPETPEGYTFTKVEGLHAAIKITPEAENGWRKVAHAFGLPAQMADNINQWFLKVNDAAVRQVEEKSKLAAQQAETALRTAWKDKFDSNKAMAQKAMEYFGGKEIMKNLGDKINDPAILSMFYNAGSKITMDGDGFPSFPSGGAGAGDGQYGSYGTLEAAQSRLKEINTAGTDANKAIFDEKNKDHEKVMEERKQLYSMVYPG